MAMRNLLLRHSTPPARILPPLAPAQCGARSPSPGFEDTLGSVQKSESQEDPSRIFIAEVDSPGAVDSDDGAAQGDDERSAKKPVRVGSAMIREDSLSSYITDRQEMKPEVDGAKDFLFLEVVISDYRTGPLHKGAGAALIEAIKRYGREKNKNTLYVDCWAGNSGKLNR